MCNNKVYVKTFHRVLITEEVVIVYTKKMFCTEKQHGIASTAFPSSGLLVADIVDIRFGDGGHLLNIR